MKKIISIILFALTVVFIVAFIFLKFQKVPPAKYPDFFNNSEKRIFEQTVEGLWEKIGLRSGYVATVQPKSIIAKDEFGQIKVFKKNTNVEFVNWEMEDSIIKYEFKFNKRKYTFKSAYPFELLYDVTSSKPGMLRKLWGLWPNRNRNDIKNVYLSFAKGLLSEISDEKLQFEWLREIEKNYKLHIGRQIIYPGNISIYKLSPAQFYRFRYQLEYYDITPAMEFTIYNLANNSLIYVHRPEGVSLFDNHFKLYSNQSTQPFLDESAIKETPFRFKKFVYHKGRKFINVSFMNKVNLNIKVDFFDDLLPVKPSGIKYDELVRKIITNHDSNCDNIALGYLYLKRQLHFNLINNPNNPNRYKELIHDLSVITNSCTLGHIGPPNTVFASRNKKDDYLKDDILPKSHKSLKVKIMPDPIVRIYYNNLDFLIPIWCNYNSKGDKQRKTGIKPTNNIKDFSNGYVVLKGKYTVEIPNLKNLLSSADLSKIFMGYGIEKIVFKENDFIPTGSQSDLRKTLREKSDSKENAIILRTSWPYKKIVKNVYSHEKFSDGEIDIVAKGLREFNNLLKNENNLTSIGGAEIRLNNESNSLQNLVVPFEIEQLGLERRPIKGQIKYNITIGNN